jgi:hypothetical protein
MVAAAADMAAVATDECGWSDDGPNYQRWLAYLTNCTVCNAALHQDRPVLQRRGAYLRRFHAS